MLLALVDHRGNSITMATAWMAAVSVWSRKVRSMAEPPPYTDAKGEGLVWKRL